MSNRRTALAVTACALLTLVACGTTEDAPQTQGAASASAVPPATSAPSVQPAPSEPATAQTEPPAEQTAGAYIELSTYDADPAAYAGSKVVYFFHADWCPKCRAAEKAFEDKGVPAGLTIVKADFDSATDLRKKYGVTVQHTYVQIDESGEQVAKWTGGYGADDLADVANRTV